MALRFGSVTDSSLRVRSLGQKRRALCAAPSYLAARGSPQEPVDLKDHNCLVMRFGQNLDNVWRFGPDTQPQFVTVRAERPVSEGLPAVRAAQSLSGLLRRVETFYSCRRDRPVGGASGEEKRI